MDKINFKYHCAVYNADFNSTGLCDKRKSGTANNGNVGTPTQKAMVSTRKQMFYACQECDGPEEI